MSPKDFRKISHLEPKILNSLVNCGRTHGRTHTRTDKCKSGADPTRGNVKLAWYWTLDIHIREYHAKCEVSMILDIRHSCIFIISLTRIWCCLCICRQACTHAHMHASSFLVSNIMPTSHCLMGQFLMSYCHYIWICVPKWLYTIKGPSYWPSKMPWPMAQITLV